MKAKTRRKIYISFIVVKFILYVMVSAAIIAVGGYSAEKYIYLLSLPLDDGPRYTITLMGIIGGINAVLLYFQILKISIRDLVKEIRLYKKISRRTKRIKAIPAPKGEK